MIARETVYPTVVESYEARLQENEPDDEYHGKRTFVSSGGIRQALDSPRAFYRGYVQGIKSEPTKAMNLGHAAHLMLLQPEEFKRRYTVMPEFTGFTKDGKSSTRSGEAQAKKAEWIADLPAGAVILDPKEHDRLMFMVEAILEHELAQHVIKDSVFEVSGYFRDPTTGLQCKIRPDVLRHDFSALPDLKTCCTAKEHEFLRAMMDMRYDVQVCFYMWGVEQITGRRPEIPGIIAVENTHPFDIAVYEFSPQMIECGMADMQLGLLRIAQSLQSGQWPGRNPREAVVIDFPQWFYTSRGII